MCKLENPNILLKESFLKMIEDYNADGDDRFKTDYFRNNFNFNSYIKDIEDCSKGFGLPEGFVQTTEWWLIDNKSNLIGTVRLRHKLGEKNYEEGGHIGYDISPRFRKQGYGKKILELVLEQAKELEIDKVLITCDSDNVGSRRIIEYNGGHYQNSVISEESGKEVLRYWIKLERNIESNFED